ncbi:MAG: hypothetical protein ACEQSC_01285 [Candidatus Nanopelagicaceae bacterium]|jgi:hypothetical protein
MFMTTAMATKSTEINSNFEAFSRLLPTVLDEHFGESVLMKAGHVVGFFKTTGAALSTAKESFPDGIFSIQKVENIPVDLGWFSHELFSRNDQTQEQASHQREAASSR